MSKVKNNIEIERKIIKDNKVKFFTGYFFREKINVEKITEEIINKPTWPVIRFNPGLSNINAVSKKEITKKGIFHNMEFLFS